MRCIWESWCILRANLGKNRLSTHGRSWQSILYTFCVGREIFLWWEDTGWADAKTRPILHHEEFRIQAHRVSSYSGHWNRCAATAHSQAKRKDEYTRDTARIMMQVNDSEVFAQDPKRLVTEVHDLLTEMARIVSEKSNKIKLMISMNLKNSQHYTSISI